MCLKELHRRLVETAKDHVLHRHVYLHCVTFPALVTGNSDSILVILPMHCVSEIPNSYYCTSRAIYCGYAFDVCIGMESALLCKVKYIYI